MSNEQQWADDLTPAELVELLDWIADVEESREAPLLVVVAMLRRAARLIAPADEATR